MLIQIILPILIFMMAFLAFSNIISQEMKPAFSRTKKHRNTDNSL